MDLSTILEVAKTNREEDVNRYLKLGWVILAVATGSNEEGEPEMKYSLGFSSEAGEEPEHPDWNTDRRAL